MTAAERPQYSRAERIADAAVHCCGVLLSLVAIPVLITLTAVLDGEPAVVAAVSVYGVAMVAMFAVSAAYHMIDAPAWRPLLRRCDHAAIYLKIAATQTPFAVFVGGDGGATMLALIWAAGLAGAAVKIAGLHGYGRLSTALYLAMGWGGLIVVWPGPTSAPLAEATTALAILGGLLYSAGVAFLVWERLRFHNAIWHGFVLAATFVFYSAVMTELLMRMA